MTYKKFAVNKLIRDNMPEILVHRAIEIDWHTLTTQEHIHALKNKIIEEADEVAQATSRQELIEELADLQEVIDALLAMHGITKENFSQVQDAKRTLRGGFAKGVYSSSIAMDEENPYIGYYLAKPKEYPEI
jgi:predicted house-cleaning noncanonical NTP pyrophosphatase (MazG superfamily)